MAQSSKWDTDRAKLLYDLGKNDSEIADLMNVSPGKVRYWRKSNGLPGIRRAPIDTDEAKRLFSLGWTDQMIANHFGVSTHAVFNFRHREQILESGKNAGSDIHFDLGKMRLLYDAGCSDVSIARELGVSENAVASWRHDEGLEPHRRLHLDDNQILSLYHKGCSDPQIAAKLGCSAQTIFRFRQKNKLPANIKTGRTYSEEVRPDTWDQEQARSLYEQGLSDREIASKLGVAHSTVGAWRKRLNLMPNGQPGRKGKKMS